MQKINLQTLKYDFDDKRQQFLNSNIYSSLRTLKYYIFINKKIYTVKSNFKFKYSIKNIYCHINNNSKM